MQIPKGHSISPSELSPDAEEVLEDKKRVRQLSERLKQQFEETLSDPIPAYLLELVDQLDEDDTEG